MSVSIFLNLCLWAFIVLIILAAMSSFGNLQSASSSSIPITSKVISYNSSASHSTYNILQISTHTHSLSKVISYNNRTTHSTNTQSYTTTTNGTLAFPTVILYGNTSQQFKNLIVPHISSILRGVSR